MEIRKWIFLLDVLLSILIIVLPVHANTSSIPWVVYYANEAPVQAFKVFDIVVLDSDEHVPIDHLHDQNKIVLGYLNLGEVEVIRDYYSQVKSEGILLQENEYWPGSYYVDVRDIRWAKRVVETLIPAILEEGFDGIFLDTLDNPAELERNDPVRFKHMTASAVSLVKLIRENYPQIKIMMNRGYELLPHVASDINMVLGESIYADYNFETKQYSLVEEELYQWQVRLLQEAKKKNPTLLVFTLDYWDKDDTAFIKEIYKVQRDNGFHPYVATIALDEIIVEPK